jgi:hypothetical protein
MHNYFKEVKEILDQLEGINFSILHELDVVMIFNPLQHLCQNFHQQRFFAHFRRTGTSVIEQRDVDQIKC